MNTTQKTSDLKTELKRFCGSESWYRHPLFRPFLYTDGIKYLAENAECYWLTDRIFSLQFEQAAIKRETFQTWFLTVSEDQTATLRCEDGNFRQIYSETIYYTDFPLAEIKLFLTSNVLLLPSEY